MTEKSRLNRVLIFILAIIAAVLFAIFLLPRLLVLVLPFLIAYLIAKIIEPLVNLLVQKIKLPRKLASGIVVIVVLALLIWLVASIFYRGVNEITNLISSADEISKKITNFFDNWEQIVSNKFGFGIANFISSQISADDLGKDVSNYLTGYIGPTLDKILSIVKSLPNVLVFTVALVLGTFFISSDSENVKAFLKRLVPKASHNYIRQIKGDMGYALMGYIRAQLILMLITFIECTIGFMLIGGDLASYALLLGIAIAIIDALPILGTGTVLIPWGLGSIIAGSTSLGLYLLVLYGICFFVRQLLEPHIISGQIGLHPLATLMAMYAGLKTIGFFGLIIGPILLLIIKNLASSGIFKAIWMRVWYGQNKLTDE
ncbi:MAG: sporulation integral membrane protein YtvI [Clostridia bacterium]|nr:sporulation integral membrane protein YtvI [Clostridia bacterium]